MYRVSCIVDPISCIVFMYRVSCILASYNVFGVSLIFDHASCIMYRVSCIVNRV